MIFSTTHWIKFGLHHPSIIGFPYEYVWNNWVLISSMDKSVSTQGHTRCVQCLKQTVFNPSRVELSKGLGWGLRVLNPSRVALMAPVSCSIFESCKAQNPWLICCYLKLQLRYGTNYKPILIKLVELLCTDCFCPFHILLLQPRVITPIKALLLWSTTLTTFILHNSARKNWTQCTITYIISACKRRDNFGLWSYQVD